MTEVKIQLNTEIAKITAARVEEEDERAFVHCGSTGLNHVITFESATELSKVSSVIL